MSSSSTCPPNLMCAFAKGEGAQGRVIVVYLAEILGKEGILAAIEGTIFVACTTLVALVNLPPPRIVSTDE